MRKKLIGLFVLASFTCVLLIPALGVGQQPGQGPGQKGKKGGKKDFGGPGADFGAGGFGGGKKVNRNGPGGGMMNFDPDSMFNMMSKGSDSIIIANSGKLQIPLQTWAFQNGITNGVISREDFGTFMTSYMQNAGFAGFGGGAGGGFGGKGGGGGNFDMDQMATQRFLKLDKNSNGYLTEDQIPSNVKAIWRQYDTNQDGVLDLEEYKALFSDVAGGGNAGKSGLGALGAVIAEEWDQRPTVFRAGKLPKELQVNGPMGWFAACDVDGDGQVALWEWRKNSGKSIAEFQIMDRNGDGLLTAEEVLSYTRAQMGISGSLSDGTMMAQNKMGANNPWGKDGGKKGGKGGPGGGKGGPGGGKGGGGKKGPKGGGGGFGGGNPWDS
jgi:Ca2+-binding EF-hand superfamily protein